MSTPSRSRPAASRSFPWHVKLRQILEDYFSEENLKTLCFDLNFDYERLAGEGKTGKIVDLIKSFARDGRIAELIDYCRGQRPNVAWDELRVAAINNPLVVEVEPDEPAPTPPRPTPKPPSPKRSGLSCSVAVTLGALALVVAVIGPRLVTRPPPLATPTAWPTATPTTRPADSPESLSRTAYSLAGDAILHYRIVEIQGREMTIEVDYRYNSQHGQEVYIGAWLQGVRSGYKPALVPSVGEGTARLAMSVDEAGASTDIDIFLYEQYQDPFARRVLPFPWTFQ